MAGYGDVGRIDEVRWTLEKYGDQARALFFFFFFFFFLVLSVVVDVAQFQSMYLHRNHESQVIEERHAWRLRDEGRVATIEMVRRLLADWAQRLNPGFASGADGLS